MTSIPRLCFSPWAPNQQQMAGKSFNFTWKFEDGKWRHKGTIKIGNGEQEINELWERISLNAGTPQRGWRAWTSSITVLFKAAPYSYEQVPYRNDPYPSSHPDHLATVAILAGLAPPQGRDCRVLELGCARGGNLIPMATALPGARSVGIDSSPRQVEEACDLIDRLGLGNIRVEARDILELDRGIGTFDYIICHGTFSWVSRDVQEKILDISAQVLAPKLAFLRELQHLSGLAFSSAWFAK